MEQFRQIGEVVGSLNALMVFQENIFNQKQCCLLVDMFTSGYKTIAEQMKQNLKFEEKNTKWKIIENPLKELLKVFREGEMYIKQCYETKDWWAKAITLYQNVSCVEFHIHNLLLYVPVVIEAIEMAGEISGWDQDEIQKKKVIYSLKYTKDLKDPRIFQWLYGDQYLISQDFCTRLDSVWEEDRWLLLKKIKEIKDSGSKQECRYADILIRNLSCTEVTDDKLLPCATLINSKDYQVRRRLGNGNQYKEIQWRGESFALRHFFGDIESLVPEISKEISLSHPNIMHAFCGFIDEEKKECYLVMELMYRDLSSYIKEICGPRKRIPFSLPVVVDIMLQIARGMEYIHSKGITHGELNPSNILVKARNFNSEGYLNVKVSGFGLSSSINFTLKTPKSSQNGQIPFIWYAPEVLEEKEVVTTFDANGGNLKYSEKSDVYSFGMICFEVLTGKAPFEDSHLQGDKMTHNIRAGERPLFPSHSPKYITNLTKKCWHVDPNQRPSFSSICRILRYTKRFLAMNPETSQPEHHPMPWVDFAEIDAEFVRSCNKKRSDVKSVTTQIPFQMFTYRVIEKEKLNMTSGTGRDYSESGSDGASTYGDENVVPTDDSLTSPTEKKSSLPPPEIMIGKISLSKKSLDIKTIKQPVTPKTPRTPRSRSVRPPQITPRGMSMSMRMNSESQLMNMTSSPRPRRTSGHVSDSELH